jgi:hypothetical protein
VVEHALSISEALDSTLSTTHTLTHTHTHTHTYTHTHTHTQYFKNWFLSLLISLAYYLLVSLTSLECGSDYHAWLGTANQKETQGHWSEVVRKPDRAQRQYRWQKFTELTNSSIDLNYARKINNKNL